MEHLPIDILTLIYNKLNIDDLDNLFTANNNLPYDEQFWLDYFKSYKLEIVEEQETNKAWVIEFKVSNIINRTQSMNIVQCKGRQCTKNSILGKIYCEMHNKMLDFYGIVETTYRVIIDCNVNVFNYLEDFFIFDFKTDLQDIDYFSSITLTKNCMKIKIKKEEEIFSGFGIYELHCFLQALFNDNVVDYVI